MEYQSILRINATNGINNLDYYNLLTNYYSGVIDPKVKSLPNRPSGPAFDMTKLETKNLLMDVFTKLKRQMGYSSKKVQVHGRR
jgi:hypothetical protein